jgi:basic amino acid/polyamine antiporter, APA family
MSNSLFRKKSLEIVTREAESGLSDAHSTPTKLKKVLSVKDLTFMGIAAVIGAGIFSTIGTAAYNGGPGVIFLFLITAVTCGFTALCYAEFASRVPVAGSAYTYSYVSFGEVIAWVIGWALILEYAIGNIVVAISWSAYFNNILKAIGVNLPVWLTIGYQTASEAYNNAINNNLPVKDLVFLQAPIFFGIRCIVNLPAFIIVALITILAYIGIQESKRTANMMVMLKILVLIVIALVGFWVIFSEGTTANWTPFLPNGMGGVLKGVSAVFFAYIGFDAISTTAEECADPQRDLPRGMIYSLIVCTIMYVVIALVITGMVSYKEFNGVADPLAYVFEKINMQKLGFVISISAVVAATSVLLVFQLGQPRIWMAMSRDGLLPSAFGKINVKFQTPGFSTIISGVLVGVLALFVDDKLMTDLTSIGTLFAFVLVSGGVLMLPRRKKETGKFNLPYLNGKWIVPIIFIVFMWFNWDRLLGSITHLTDQGYQELLFLIFVLLSSVLVGYTFIKNYSFIPVMGVLFCMYLMIEIPSKSWMVFFGWMAIGLSIYLLYGYRHSKLKKNN